MLSPRNHLAVWPTPKPNPKHPNLPKAPRVDDRVARKQVGGREQIEGKKSEVTEDE